MNLKTFFVISLKHYLAPPTLNHSEVLIELMLIAEAAEMKLHAESMRALKDSAKKMAQGISKLTMQVVNAILSFASSRKSGSAPDAHSTTTQTGGKNPRTILTDAGYTSKKVLANADTTSRVDTLRSTYGDNELTQLIAKGKKQKKGIGSILDGLEGKKHSSQANRSKKIFNVDWVDSSDKMKLLKERTAKRIIVLHGKQGVTIIDKFSSNDNIEGLAKVLLGDKGKTIVAKISQDMVTESGYNHLKRFFNQFGGDAGKILDAHGYPPPYWKASPAYKADQVENVWDSAKEKKGNKFSTENEVEKIRTKNGTVSWDKSKPTREGQWDMGHIKDEKYSKRYERFLKGEFSKEEFLEWYQTEGNYEPQTIPYNRGHKGE